MILLDIVVRHPIVFGSSHGADVRIESTEVNPMATFFTNTAARSRRFVTAHRAERSACQRP